MTKQYICYKRNDRASFLAALDAKPRTFDEQWNSKYGISSPRTVEGFCDYYNSVDANFEYLPFPILFKVTRQGTDGYPSVQTIEKSHLTDAAAHGFPMTPQGVIDNYNKYDAGRWHYELVYNPNKRKKR